MECSFAAAEMHFTTLPETSWFAVQLNVERITCSGESDNRFRTVVQVHRIG